MKCNVCRKEYSTSCDYKQGRCPLHPPVIELKIPVWRQLVYFILVPFIVGAFMIIHPRKVWEQAKKDWNL